MQRGRGRGRSAAGFYGSATTTLERQRVWDHAYVGNHKRRLRGQPFGRNMPGTRPGRRRAPPGDERNAQLNAEHERLLAALRERARREVEAEAAAVAGGHEGSGSDDEAGAGDGQAEEEEEEAGEEEEQQQQQQSAPRRSKRLAAARRRNT